MDRKVCFGVRGFVMWFMKCVRDFGKKSHASCSGLVYRDDGYAGDFWAS